jgi:dCTP deaminase
MGEAATLFPMPAPEPAKPQDSESGAAERSTGILPSQAIAALIEQRAIDALVPILPEQIQPASLDLRLGKAAYRVRASFLPGPGATVMQKVRALGMHQIDLTDGAVLERDCVYIVPLLEHVRLGYRESAFANPKSSTGRLDVFTRLITDHGTAFDRVPALYEGPLYLEVAPRTFSIVVRAGSRLNQLRLRHGSPPTSAAQLEKLHEQFRLVDSGGAKPNIRHDSIGVTLDLEGDADGLIGYRAKKHSDVVDIDRRAIYDPLDYWDPIYRRQAEGVVLNPDDFYILATKEAVRVPPDHAAEMVAYDTLSGEFRVHYAGFFDPGFGMSRPSKAVLEVRSHDVPFMLEHEQIVGWLRYERLTAPPERVYGQDGIGSSYQGQGLMLAKQFRRPA